MSSETNETIADILREMRDPNSGFCRWYADGGSCDCPKCVFDALADRIEAAAELDAAIHAMTCEANDRLREHLEIALEGKHGNAAAMRAALEEQLRYWNAHVRTRDEEEMRKRTEAALAAPARNCDVLSEEAANKSWDDYRHAHVLPHGGWDFRHIIAWLFAKAEGVAKCVNGLRGDPDCRGCEEHCEDVRRRNCINWSGDHCAKTKGIFCPVSCDEFRAYKPAEGGAE